VGVVGRAVVWGEVGVRVGVAVSFVVGCEGEVGVSDGTGTRVCLMLCGRVE
jgi:hypothetical protein